MEQHIKPMIPPLPVILKMLKISGDPDKAVPRQVKLMPVDAPDECIIATATGIELDRANGAVRVALTGGMRHTVPLRYIELKGFNGETLVWDAIFHNHAQRPFKVTVKFGPAIGF